MKEQVIELIKSVLETETNISEDTVMEDVAEWDSFGQVAILDALQQKYKIKFSFDEMLEMNSVSRIIEIVQRLTD